MITEKEYEAYCVRIEELLKVVTNANWDTNPLSDELNQISNLVADYEEATIPMERPSFTSLIELRMEEMGLSLKDFSSQVEISPNKLNNFLEGKTDITLRTAKNIGEKLNICPEIILQ